MEDYFSPPRRQDDPGRAGSSAWCGRWRRSSRAARACATARSCLTACSAPGLWAAAFSLLGYFLAENIGLAEDIAGRGIFLFGTLVVVVVGYLAYRYLRVPENRAKLVGRMEGNRLRAPLVAAGRRVKPQARFLWQRLTPGNLGLEFTSAMAVLAVSLFIVVGLRR